MLFRKLQNITLDTIKKLRELVNDTILDVLLFTSPLYAQVIINQVASELNRLHSLFLSRNPGFNGKICVFGHSLGTCILFDLLAHQPVPRSNLNAGSSTDTDGAVPSALIPEKPAGNLEDINEALKTPTNTFPLDKYEVKYPVLNFKPFAFFAAGSPVGMFLTIRGHDSIGVDYQLPTCSNVYNIFHPFDPVVCEKR